MDSEREMDSQTPTDSKKRVLAVDDDPSIRHMLERVLSRTYDLVLAADGELALAEIRRQRPDLVLLDLRMPVMDGSELLERLEGEGIDVPVVLMTAEIRHGFLDSPLVRARHDKLLGVDALLDTCARVLAGPPTSSEGPEQPA